MGQVMLFVSKNIQSWDIHQENMISSSTLVAEEATES